MREFNEKSITQAVIERLAQCDDPRFKRVMTSLVTHLHDFVREVRLTEPEWLAAIEFLTDVGKTCTPKRQEFILLSDTLGVSVLVITLNHPADNGSAESTVLGPFYWEGAPDLPRGSNLAEGVKGEPTFYSGRVLSADGKPLANALLDIWSGRRRRQLRHADPRRNGHEGARQDPHRRRGSLLVSLDPPDVLPGADRRPGGAHAAEDGPPSESARTYSHDRLRRGHHAGDDPPVRCRQ